MTSSNDEPLQPIDVIAVEQHWREFTQANSLDGSVKFTAAFQFGDHSALATELAQLVLTGPKRATCGTVAGLEAAKEPIPSVGDYWVVCNGAGCPLAVIRTTDVRLGPLSSVDDQFAWDEGEGDRSRAEWLDIHTDCFTRQCVAMGTTMHPDIEVVFERFELL